MYPMEHQILPPPHYHQENDDLPRGRRKNGPHTSNHANSQYRPPQPDTNPTGQEGQCCREKEEGSASKKVQAQHSSPSLMRQPCTTTCNCFQSSRRPRK